MIESLRRLSLCAALCALLGLSTTSVLAQTATYQFDLPAQPLADALRAVGRQASKNILFDPALVEGISVPALRAELTVGDAVKRLLAGTKLSTQEIASDTVLIRNSAREAAKKPAGSKTTSIAGPNGRVHLAQADAGEGGTAQRRVGETESQELPAPEDRGSAIPEILVRGSKSLNSDIRRSEDVAQPYVVFDRETIERSGARNLEDFLQQRLTAATTFGSSSQNDSRGYATSEISLRGLGPDETLILIDGRRAAGFGLSDASSHQPDLNGIPLAAVERIEVLPTTASGIYGGGATGGVINVVLRRDYSGVESRMTYGNTFDSAVASRRVDLSMGLNLEGGRTNILFAGSYADSDDLLVGDRDLEQRRRARILSSNPGSILGSFPPLGATTNVMSLSGGDLSLAGTGLMLDEPIAYIPRGYAGIASDGGAALLSTAGQYNLALANTAQTDGARQSLLNGPAVKSIMTTLRREMTGSLDVFLELAASQNRGEFAISDAISQFVLAAGDPGNPFNEDVFVNTPAFGTDGTGVAKLDSYRGVAGLIFKLPREWRLAAGYTWNRTRFISKGVGLLDAAAANVDVASGDLDIFRDTNDSPPDFSSYLTVPNTQGPAETTLSDLSLRLSGPMPWSLPGGAPTVSSLLEAREETLGEFFAVVPSTLNSISYRLGPRRSQAVASAYVEAVLPFVSSSNGRAGLRLLELQIAARHDEYRTRGANFVETDENQVPLEPIVRQTNRVRSTDPTFGLRYRPLNGVTLRASYGTGFLPPAVNELQSAGPVPIPGGFLTDLARGGESVGAVLYSFGGNQDLDPEQSKSRSLGLIVEPVQVPGLRIAADWTRITKTGAISTLNALSQSGLDALVRFLPGRLTRDPDPATFGSFGIGPITGIDDSLVNIARSKVEAFDFGTDYQVGTQRLGTFSLAANATHLVHNRTTLSPDATPVENADYFGDLKWRANASVTWDYSEWIAAWTLRYFASACVDLGCALNADQGARRVPSQTYHDFYLGRRFDSIGLEVQLGVNNVFDTKPPVYIYGRYSQFGDPRLANYYLTLRKDFATPWQ